MSETMTYFIQSATGPVKIGVSLSPETRLRDLQVGCPYPLMLLATLPGDREAELHGRFAPLRMSGEWFRWDSAIRDYLSNAADIERVSAEPFGSLKETAIPSVEFFCPIVIDGAEVYEQLAGIWPMDGRDVCGQSDDSAMENCDCDFHVWHRSIVDLASCDVIDRLGVNFETQTMFVSCKPLNSSGRIRQAQDTLPVIADDLDIIGWELHGWVSGPTVPAHIVSFNQLQYTKESDHVSAANRADHPAYVVDPAADGSRVERL